MEDYNLSLLAKADTATSMNVNNYILTAFQNCDDGQTTSITPYSYEIKAIL